MRSSTELLTLADEKDQEARRHDEAVTKAVLDGKDKAADAAQAQADAARQRAGQLRQAAASAEESEEADRQKARKDAQAAAMTEVAKAAEEFRKKAEHIDAAMLSLGTQYEDMILAGMAFQSALRKAGMGNDARITNGLKSGARWAFYQHATALAEDMGTPRVPGNRRQTMLESVHRLSPQVPVTELERALS